MDREVKVPRTGPRTRGRSRISSKNQVTLPVAALGEAGLRPGDRVRIECRGPGQLVIVRDADPVSRFAGSLTGVYGPGYLDRLRDEWP